MHDRTTLHGREADPHPCIRLAQLMPFLDGREERLQRQGPVLALALDNAGS